MAGRDDAGIYWWETAPQDSRPSLTDRVQADVAIVGGGYTGLWTAYQLLEAEPSLKIVILEGQRIGFGASGRNGGFAMTLLDMSLAHLRKNQGDGPARDAHQAVARSVEEMGETITSQDIECEWKHGGLMVVASNPGQLKRVDADVEAAEALGLEGFRRLSADEARAEVDSPTYIGALHEEHCGVLHPAKLAHGLARTVERAGATIYERSESTGIEETGDGLMRISTPRGEVVADQVVLATNAWACQTPWFKRKVVPLYTYIALTEPLTDLQWASIGWDRHQGIEDKRNYVHYYRRTLDGRILWGGSDGIVYSRSRIRPEYVRHDGVLARLRSTFEKTFPQVADVPFSHHWGGPVA
ncbi:MAG TPA: FAD-dependent oxidoreductase, partial [Acidimicrobiia bacterium]|nr:FAD-dependent oxidoreductase [Acidimicrobiia bacterium]